MRHKKVKTYAIPNYATKKDLLTNSDLLKNNVPRKWEKNKLLLSTLTIFILNGEINSKDKSIDMNVVAMQETDEYKKELNTLKSENTKNRLPLIAPLFIHGDGRGATGCMVMNPPTFLSEEEARQIIEEELMKENIIFDKKNYKIDDAVFQSRWEEEDDDTVNIDAYSTKYNLGYEFVSSVDYHKFGGGWDGSTVTSYDVVKASENLREKLKGSGKINTVIFYDPIADAEDGKGKSYYENNYFEKKSSLKKKINNYRKLKKDKSIELLKKQISDFIEWAKKEELLND